jgi:hypothetical protein
LICYRLIRIYHYLFVNISFAEEFTLFGSCIAAASTNNNNNNNNMSQPEDTSSSANVIQVMLDDAMFAECVQRYIDEDKPDSLQQKQMESWVWHWQNNSSVSNTADDNIVLASFAPTHIVSGTLSIQGEYIAVTLTCECAWKGDGDDGSLFFSCRASAQSIPETAPNTAASSSSLSPKEQKQQAKIRQKMLTRLQEDDYIKKILKLNGTASSSPSNSESLELCQATIHIAKSTSDSNLPSVSQLEERVHCNQDVAEAIRRAIFSTAEAPLDVFDLICRCAILPSTSLASTVPYTTPLADRAKLRILEDATYDACENEEEEEIVQDLNIERRDEVVAEQSTKKKKSKR